MTEGHGKALPPELQRPDRGRRTSEHGNASSAIGCLLFWLRGRGWRRAPTTLFRGCSWKADLGGLIRLHDHSEQCRWDPLLHRYRAGLGPALHHIEYVAVIPGARIAVLDV